MDRGWVAGLLEGEGTFYPKATTGYPYIACHMTDHDVLTRLQGIVGGSTIPMKKQYDHHRPSWRWCAGGALAVEIMTTIRPLMGTRRGARIDELLAGDVARRDRAEEKRTPTKSAARAYLNGEGTTRECGALYGVSHVAVINQVKTWKKAMPV